MRLNTWLVTVLSWDRKQDNVFGTSDMERGLWMSSSLQILGGDPQGLSSEASAALRVPRTVSFQWDLLGHNAGAKEMMKSPIEGLVFQSLAGGVSSIHFQSYHGCNLYGQEAVVRVMGGDYTEPDLGVQR